MNVSFGDDPKHPVRRACATVGEILGSNPVNNGKTLSAKNERADINDYDLVSELLQRHATFRRCDHYINNSEFDCRLQELWKQIKSREEANIKRLQELLAMRSGGLLSLIPDLTEPEHIPSQSSPK